MIIDIDFSPKAYRQYQKIYARLDPGSQDRLRKLLLQLNKSVSRSLARRPPEADKYNFVQGVVSTLLYDYEFSIAGWMCECCNRPCTEVIHIDEHVNVGVN